MSSRRTLRAGAAVAGKDRAEAGCYLGAASRPDRSNQPFLAGTGASSGMRGLERRLSRKEVAEQE